MDGFMFPWIKEALDLSYACRSFRLARDRKGVWRPAATPADIEAAFATIASVLEQPSLAAWEESRRVEETERLRMALQAMTKLCLTKGASTEEIANTLEPILAGDIPGGPEDAPLAWTLVPRWARKRAKRRIEAAQKPKDQISLQEGPPPPLVLPSPQAP